MKYQSFLSRRHLTRRFIPIAAVLAVAGSIFCLIPVLSVMEGFKVSMRSQIRGTLSHLSVRSPAQMGMNEQYAVGRELLSTVLYEDLTDLAIERHGLGDALDKLGIAPDATHAEIAELLGESWFRRAWLLDDIESRLDFFAFESLVTETASDDHPPGLRALLARFHDDNSEAVAEPDAIVDAVNRIRVEEELWNRGYEASLEALDIERTPDLDRRLEPVAAVAPYAETIALFKAGNLSHCLLRGIDPSAEVEVGNFRDYLLRDKEVDALTNDRHFRVDEDRKPLSDEEIAAMFSLEHRRQLQMTDEFLYRRDGNVPEPDGFAGDEVAQPIVVGIQAIRLGLFRLGRRVQLSSTTPGQEVRAQTFIVVGAFQTKLYEHDLTYVYAPLPAVQSFLELDDPELGGRYTGFSVRLTDYAYAPRVKRHLQRNGISGYFEPDQIVAKTWEDERHNLLQAVDVEKHIISVMMLLIVGFAGIVIFLILTVMIIEKTRDLGVLRSLGATPRGVVWLFVRTGMTLCVVGTTLGITAGFTFTVYLNDVHNWIEAKTGWTLFPSDIYYFTEIPVAYRWTDWALILIPTIALGFVASLIPAVWAARRDPIGALRHE